MYEGPKVSQVEVNETGEVLVSFEDSDSELCMKGNQVGEIELKCANGQYYPAKAVVKENKLIVSTMRTRNPKGIRYAWRDCPMNANLYNSEGLPAVPFCREWV